MAYLGSIWVHDLKSEKRRMRAFIEMKPYGEACVEIELPEKFLDTIVRIAQTAADAHEALARAEILGDMQEVKKD
jgi:hypothetical protein